MNIHEYQAKKILKEYGILIPKGGIVYTPGEARRTAQNISPGGPWVLKAQIHSGARAEGRFLEKKSGKEGGVRLINGRRDVFSEADKMLGCTLVTEQTGSKGKLVSKIYVEEYVPADKTFYVSLVIDRMVPCITLLVTAETTNILDLAVNDPQKILRLNLDLNGRITQRHSRLLLEFLQLGQEYENEMKDFIAKLFHAFKDLDAVMMEINPVGINKDGSFIALDAKIAFDDHALFRHRDIIKLHDDYEDNERALKASQYGFQYGEFDEGSVGAIVNGDGLTLTVVDLLQNEDENMACFLNVKGGVDKDKIAAGIKIIMTNPRVEGILINILGGFLRCDLVADGIVSAASEVGLNVPLVVRFEGTNKREAQEILHRSNLPVIMAGNLEDSVCKLLRAMEDSD